MSDERLTCEQLLAQVFDILPGGGTYKAREPKATDLSRVTPTRFVLTDSDTKKENIKPVSET